MQIFESVSYKWKLCFGSDNLQQQIHNTHTKKFPPGIFHPKSLMYAICYEDISPGYNSYFVTNTVRHPWCWAAILYHLLFKYAKCNYDIVVIIEKNSFNQIQIQQLFLPLKTSTQCPPIYTPVLITWCPDNLKASLLHLWKHADLFGDLFDSWSSWILYMYREYFLFILGSLPLPS